MTYIEKHPAVRVAQEATEKWASFRSRAFLKSACPADGALVIWLWDGSLVGAVSYGDTKKLCGEYGKILDRTCDFLESEPILPNAPKVE
jgi:hypothetical protein